MESGELVYEPRRIPRFEELVVRGVSYNLTWWGEPSDSPIVLLHGFMDSGRAWQFLVDCLPATCPCVAPDWSGFGNSERLSRGYWFPDYLADLEILLDALVPQRPARIIGHSMGANIAALYAGIRPKRLAWLANLEGLGPERITSDRAPVRYEEWLDQLGQELHPNHYKTPSSLASGIRLHNPRLTPAKAEFVARAWTRPTGSGVEMAADPRHRLVNPILPRREEAEACWRRVEIPMLLLLGQRSERRARLGADATDEYFRSIFRDVRIVTIAGAGHMLHHEVPEAVSRHILEFARLQACSASWSQIRQATD